MGIIIIIIITYLNLFFCSYVYSNGYYEIGEQSLLQNDERRSEQVTERSEVTCESCL